MYTPIGTDSGGGGVVSELNHEGSKGESKSKIRTKGYVSGLPAPNYICHSSLPPSFQSLDFRNIRFSTRFFELATVSTNMSTFLIRCHSLSRFLPHLRRYQRS